MLKPVLTTTFDSVRHTRWGAALTALVVALLFSTVPVYFVMDHQEARRQHLSDEANRHLASKMVQIETNLQRAKAFPSAAILAVSQSADPARFEDSVRGLLRLTGIVKAVNFAPASGQPVVVRRNKSEQEAMLELRLKPGVAVSLQLESTQRYAIGDGTLLISQPVNFRADNGELLSWGVISAEASLADLIQELQLLQLVNDGFGIDFSVRWQSGATESAIFRSSVDPNNGYTATYPLIGKDMLALTIAPPAVVLSGLPLLAAFLATVAVLVLFLLSYYLMRRPQLLQEEVSARVSEIAAEKISLSHEIARHTETATRLERSYGLLDSIFEHSPGMIVVKRVSDLRIARINQSGERILGRSRDFLLGRCNEELYAPHTADFLTHGDRLALESTDMVDLYVQRVEMLAADPRWIGYRKTVLRDRNGAPQYILEFGEDVTEREDLDRRLHEQLHFLEQLIEAFPGPIFSKDVDGHILAVNTPYEQLVGKSRDALVGKSTKEFVPEASNLETLASDKALLQNGGKQVYEALTQRPDGSFSEYMVHRAVFRDSDARPAGIVSISLDISERKASERTVVRQNRVLTVLSAINHLIIRSSDRGQLLEDARRILEENGDFPAVWICDTNSIQPQPMADVRVIPFVQRIMEEIRVTAPQISSDRSSRSHVLTIGDDKLLSDLRGQGLCPMLLLPLRSHGTDWGEIGILGAVGQTLTEAEKSLLEEMAGNLAFAVAAIQHDHARQTAEHKLQLASHVFENSAEGVMITDASSNILLVNRRFTEITGYAHEEVIGRSPKILNSGQQDDAFYGNLWRSLVNRGEWHGEIRNRRKDGEVIVEWLNISAVKDEYGKLSNYVGIFTEITVHKKLRKRMQYLAHYDVLTSLPNRVLFSDRLEQSIISAKRNNCMTALLFIDLDHFDTINKNLGHAAGDLILQEVSTRLLGEIPEGSSVSRLGSDEFAVVLPDVKSFTEPSNTAVRLLQALNRSMFVRENELNVSASIGISLYPADGADSDVLTKSAETAMYQAVEAGGNTFRLFNPPERRALSDRQKLRDRLFRAMERDELRVFYQPLISASTGCIVGVEALLRWFRPETGYVSPQSFVPLMEESGLVLKVGDWVLRNAMTDCAKWQTAFGTDLTVTVNLSQAEFVNAHCVEGIESALKDLVFDPSYLQIEMSESTVMREAPSSLARLHQLNDIGVRLSIDNFGTGFSSVSYLKRFPIHSIKIDRSFVFDTPNDEEAVAVVRAIGAMGRSLKLDMTAEGVETASQVEFLRSVGCDTFQGYRFAEALSSEAFAKLLASKKRFDFFSDDREVPEHLHLVR